MRVLFLTLYPESAASARYRVHQFIPYLEASGVECVVAPAVSEEVYRRGGWAGWYHLAETRRRIGQIVSARRYDVVFVQKAVMSAYLLGMWGLLRSRARRIVYDVDDAVHLRPPHGLGWPWKVVEDRGQVEKVFREAELVLAGNGWLVEEVVRRRDGDVELGGGLPSPGPSLRGRGVGDGSEVQVSGGEDSRAGRPCHDVGSEGRRGACATDRANGVAWFPTVVDTGRFLPGTEGADVFRVGWMGSPSTSGALGVVAGVLKELTDAEVCLVGGGEGTTELVPGAMVLPWSIDSEAATLQSFSVGIMPLHGTKWDRGKCALKALQYMACGVPCVATPFGAILDIVEHDRNGLFAETPAEWRDAFERLRDPAERRRLGEAGRATVVERFSLEHAAPRLLRLLESIV